METRLISGIIRNRSLGVRWNFLGFPGPFLPFGIAGSSLQTMGQLGDSFDHNVLPQPADLRTADCVDELEGCFAEYVATVETVAALMDFPL